MVPSQFPIRTAPSMTGCLTWSMEIGTMRLKSVTMSLSTLARSLLRLRLLVHPPVVHLLHRRCLKVAELHPPPLLPAITLHTLSPLALYHHKPHKHLNHQCHQAPDQSPIVLSCQTRLSISQWSVDIGRITLSSMAVREMCIMSQMLFQKRPLQVQVRVNISLVSTLPISNTGAGNLRLPICITQEILAEWPIPVCIQMCILTT